MKSLELWLFQSVARPVWHPGCLRKVHPLANECGFKYPCSSTTKQPLSWRNVCFTCVMSDKADHYLKSVELGCIVESSVALRVSGIDDLLGFFFRQGVEIILHNVFPSISGCLQEFPQWHLQDSYNVHVC